MYLSLEHSQLLLIKPTVAGCLLETFVSRQQNAGRRIVIDAGVKNDN
jgi:hypothetical protein